MNRPAFLFSDYPIATTVTPTDSYSGHDADDVLEPNETARHRFADSTGTKDYVFNFGEAITLEFIALLGENLDGISCEVRASTDNFVASDVQLLAATTLSAGVNAAWSELTTTGDYQYCKVRLSSIPSDLFVAHVSLGELLVWRFLSEDYDPDNLEATGEAKVSAGGYHSGGVAEKVVRRFPINAGQMTETEYAGIYKPFADQVIANVLGCFFVPDIDEAEVFYGWLSDYRYSAPLKNCVRTVAPFDFVTRAI